MEIIQRDPTTLRIHPDLHHHPRWADDDVRLKDLTRSVLEWGVRQPIQITAAGEIADGRHRWFAAKRAQLVSVPCVLVADEEVTSVILHSLHQRQHYTPGQLAFLAVTHLEKALQESTQRRIANLVQFATPAPVRAKTFNEYANELGISPRTLEEAMKLWKHFREHTEKRTITDKWGITEENVTFAEFFTPRIFDQESPYGIGAANAGIGFILEMEKKGTHTGGKPKDASRQINLFNRVVEDEIARWDYWAGFDDQDRRDHFSTVRARFETLPADQLHHMAEYHETLAKLARKAGKTQAD